MIRHIATRGNLTKNIKTINMKKFFTTIILPVMFLVVGCVDLDELWNEIDLLKKQNTEQSNEMKDQKLSCNLSGVVRNLNRLKCANSVSPPSKGW